jgi:hypothetical protein
MLQQHQQLECKKFFSFFYIKVKAYVYPHALDYPPWALEVADGSLLRCTALLSVRVRHAVGDREGFVRPGIRRGRETGACLNHDYCGC